MSVVGLMWSFLSFCFHRVFPLPRRLLLFFFLCSSTELFRFRRLVLVRVSSSSSISCIAVERHALFPPSPPFTWILAVSTKLHSGSFFIAPRKRWLLDADFNVPHWYWYWRSCGSEERNARMETWSAKKIHNPKNDDLSDKMFIVALLSLLFVCGWLWAVRMKIPSLSISYKFK